MVEILKKEDLLECVDNGCLDLNSKIYFIETNEKYLIIKRVGECDYKKCKSICCKFVCGGGNSYWEGFSKKNEFGDSIIDIRCKNLNKKGACNLFKKKGFPGACKQFPHPTDGVYRNILDKCSFKFEILYQVNKIGERFLQEMIRNFEEQKG